LSGCPLPRPAWPERLVDAQLGQMPCGFPARTSSPRRPGRCGVRRTRRIPRLAASMASWRVSPARRQTRHPCACRPLRAESTAPRPRFGTGDVRPWCIRTSRSWQSRAVTAQHAQRATTVQRDTKQHHRSPTSTSWSWLVIGRSGVRVPPRAPPTPPLTCDFADSAPAADVSSSRGVSVVRPSVQDASRRCRSTRTCARHRRPPQASSRRGSAEAADHHSTSSALRSSLWVTAREWVEEQHDSGHAAGSCPGQDSQQMGTPAASSFTRPSRN